MTTHTRLFSVAEYHRMSDKGIFQPDERVELLNGKIIAMAAKKPPHSLVTQCVSDYLKELLQFPGIALVRTQEPIHLDSRSEPEPDIAVVRLPLLQYEDHHPYPGEIYLVIEVADTTLHYDRRTKASAYAEAGIPDYWVIDVKERIHTFREPGTKKYQYEKVYDKSAKLALVAFPDIKVIVHRFFP